MRRLMSFARNLGSETREACKCFPLTMSAVFLIGILYFVGENTTWVSNQMVQTGMFFFFLFAVASFFLETVWLTRGRLFWYLQAGNICIAAVGTFFLHQQGGIEGIFRNGIVWGGIGRYLAGYCLILGILSAYIWLGRSGQRLEAYCISLLQQSGKVTVIFLLIVAGCSGLARIFSFLILNNRAFLHLDSLLGLIVTFFYIPALSLIWRQPPEKIEVLVERIVKFILLPVSIFAGVIMYLYIIKLLIPFTMPSNQIFKMVTVLFAGGIFTWTLLGYYEEDSWYMKLAEKLPYFYLPFLIIQGYTLGVRLASYGMTPNRYLGIVILISEFLYLCFYRVQREQIGNILPFFAVLIFFATWVPGMNLEDVSIRNQKMIAEQYYTQDNADRSQESWERIYGAYLWLAEQPECMAYVANTFPDEVVEEIERQSGNTSGNPAGLYWLYDANLVEQMEVSGYTTVTHISSVWNADAQEQQHDMTQVIFQVSDQNGQEQKDEVALNLQEVFDAYIRYYQECGYKRSEEAHRYIKAHNRFQLSEQYLFYADSIEVVINKDSDEIIKYAISGYLLER